MGNVGGDPGRMTGGASDLHASATTMEQMRTGLGRAGTSVSGAVGAPELQGAVERFFAAWSAMVGDTGTQVLAASQLASNAAADLATAGGGH